MKNSKPIIMIDFGGVYFRSVRPVARKIEHKFHISRKIIDYTLWYGPYWKKYAEGRSNKDEYWNNVSKKLKISNEQTKWIRKTCYSYFIPQKGMAKLVKALKRKYKVVVLSSQIEDWIKFLEKKYKLSKRFHEQHYSFNYGVDKPSVRLFKSAAKKMKTKPENCIVIDDNKVFLSGIKKTGARTIHFKNSKQLETQLRKMGIEI